MTSLEDLCKNFERFLKYIEISPYLGDMDSVLNYAQSSLEQVDLDIDSRVINKFLKRIKDYGELDYSGIYISALMNSSIGEKLNLILPFPPNYLGFRLENKKVRVRGEIGNNFADKAKNCEFYVRGNLGNNALSYASNCKIKVIGNVGNFFGVESRACDVEIYGDAKDGFMKHSINTEVEVKGNLKNFIGFGAVLLTLTIDGNCGSIGYDVRNSHINITGNTGNLGPAARDSKFEVGGIVKGNVANGASDCEFNLNKVRGEIGGNASNCVIHVASGNVKLSRKIGSGTEIYFRGKKIYPKENES